MQPERPCRTQWQRKWLRLDVTCPAVQAMADATEKFCARWFRNKPHPALLVLAGASGVGKTHCAQAVFDFARAGAFSGYELGFWAGPASLQFLRWPEVCDGFKEGNYGIVEDCLNAGLLILDDIGAEHDPSRSAANKLCEILSRREDKFTLVTTNIDPAAWAQRFDVRINDRLLRNSTVIDLGGVSSYALV